MVIESLKVEMPFKYLWLKTVERVDLTQHCARCLIGQYDKRINANVTDLEDIPLENSVYYLCGDSAPYVWANNFHLAFKPCKGKQVVYENNGIRVVINDAERIEFDENDIDFTLVKSRISSFKTCRNWQFANKFVKSKGE
jgi:hypothetical protein